MRIVIANSNNINNKSIMPFWLLTAEMEPAWANADCGGGETGRQGSEYIYIYIYIYIYV